MLPAEELGKEINTIRNDLMIALSKCQDRALIGKTNSEKYTKVDTQLNSFIALRSDLRQSINHLVEIYKNIESFVSCKKERNLTSLKAAIVHSGSIVPDANMRGINLSVKGKKAKILSENGQNINQREGSALRATMSMLIRYTLIRQDRSAIQFVLLDEAFSTLSDITSSNMRECLKIFGEDILLIGIEQRKVLFEGITDYECQFIKDENGKTRVKVET